MSTQVAVPDVLNVGLHRSVVMSSMSSNTSTTSQPLHSLGCPPRNPPYVRLDDSSSHSGFLEGLPHVHARLDARQYKSAAFAQQLLDILKILRVPSWSQTIAPHPVPCIRKVSGCLTNAVFFVSSPLTSSRTLLLRIFGPSSNALISRRRELHVLHALSSKFNLGPRIYGTFTNGRLEEYFDSVTLTPSDIREPQISAYIGARMAELHGVDVAITEGQSDGRNIELGVRRNVHSWLPHAQSVLALPAITPAIRKELDLERFQTKWENYVKWLKTAGALDAHPVFCHNDAQYGNLLRLNKVEEGTPKHHQIIVVDFEYASPNPAAFDIANHFHEWTTDYHSSTPHVLDPSRYPTHAQRRTFLTAYLEHRPTAVKPHAHAHVEEHASVFSDLSPAARERELVALEKAVCMWGPASHAMWALWGLVQAREDVLANVAQPEFDYVGYARCRMAAFYRDLAVLSA